MALIAPALALAVTALLVACPGARAAGVFSLPLPVSGWEPPSQQPPAGLATSPDGSYLYTDGARVLRVAPDGRRSVVGGSRSSSSPNPPADGMPVRSATLSPQSIAVSPDGSILLTEGHRIWRVLADGTMRRVAGRENGDSAPTPEQGPAPGDGGPAREAYLSSPQNVELLPDGGFLFADLGFRRIRRVHPDGTITTVAGSGSEGAFSGEGGPATDASIGYPLDVASTADSGFMFLSYRGFRSGTTSRVWRVGPDGTLHAVAGNGGAQGFAGDGGPATQARLSNPLGIAPLPDGGVMIADTGNHRLRRVTPDGRIETVAGSGKAGDPDSEGLLPEESRSGLFTRQGRYPPTTAIGWPFALAQDPLGGMLIAHQKGISQLADLGGRRMGLAIAGVDVAKRRLSFIASAPATVNLELRHRGRKLAAMTAQAVAGRNRIRLPRGRRGPHTVILKATNEHGSWDDDRVAFVMGGTLSIRVARGVAQSFVFSGASLSRSVRRPQAHAADGPYEAIGECKRFGRRRVDCEYYDLDSGGCISIESVRLRTNGLIYKATYPCARRGTFTRRPRKLSPARPVPLL